MAYFKCSGALFNGTIIINTTAGATVTATTASTTRSFQAVANAGGVATIRVKKRGTYNIASTGTTRIGHATVSNSTPVTAVYNWQKWNCLGAYSKTKSASGTPSSDTAVMTGLDLPICGSGYSYNTSNGKYTLTGADSYSYQGVILGKYTYNAILGKGRGPYTAPNDGANWMYYYNDTMTYRYWYSGDVKKSELVVRKNTYYEKWTSTFYYYKGGTNYGTVSSTSLNTYPNNGRYSGDGYWYVAS